MKHILADGSTADRPDPTERKVVRTMVVLLVLSTVLFTGIHHALPRVFNAPPRQSFEKPLPDKSYWVLYPEGASLQYIDEYCKHYKVSGDNVCIAARPGGECIERVPDNAYFIFNCDGIPEERVVELTENAPRPIKISVPPDGALLKAALPGSSYGAMFLLDLIPIALAWLCFHHAWRRLGIYRAMLFLGGSFVFTGLEESMWILLGRFQEQLQALGGAAAQEAALGARAHEVTGTYYFTKGFFWFLETPLLACLGWFFVAYSCVYVADILLPKAKIIWRATLGGLLAVNLDLWLDPVQTHWAFLSWIWGEGDMIQIFSIPFSNFAGWFLLIFLFAIVFDKVPAMISRWGPVKTAFIFYSILFALEIGILLFFIVYGSIAMRLIPEPINFTIMDIGVGSLTL